MDNPTVNLLAEAGVQIGSQVMENGEARHRMMVDGGRQGYIHTVAGREGAWQNAHFHRGNREIYAVVTGWMVFASQDSDGRRQVKVLFPDDGAVCPEPGVPHNVYLPSGASIHTVKWGTAIGNKEKGGADWYPAPPEFDVWTKSLTVMDIAREADVKLKRLQKLS